MSETIIHTIDRDDFEREAYIQPKYPVGDPRRAPSQADYLRGKVQGSKPPLIVRNDLALVFIDNGKGDRDQFTIELGPDGTLVGDQEAWDVMDGTQRRMLQEYGQKLWNQLKPGAPYEDLAHYYINQWGKAIHQSNAPITTTLIRVTHNCGDESLLKQVALIIGVRGVEAMTVSHAIRRSRAITAHSREKAG